MHLAIIHADPARKFSALLTKLWTGSTAYHCGFVDHEDGTFFDMNLLPRKIAWPRYHPPVKWVVLYDVPGITRADCEAFMKEDGMQTYGVLDYILFGLRPLFHLLGRSTRNARGLICSEMCALWLQRVGYGIATDPVPSPGDLETWAVNHLIKAA